MNNEMKNTETFSGKKIVICLIIICLIALGFKLYLVDFSIPIHSDALEYALHANAINDGQFLQHPQRHSGWPVLIASFFSLINSENFLDYSNIVRVLSIGISTVTIPLVYLLGRKFFDKKLSLIAASLFAFEPRLNQISGIGVSEPLFILVIVSSFYFILDKNNRYVVIPFILTGIIWWIRPNGFMMLLIISIIYFIYFRNSSHSIRNYLIYIAIVFLIVSPMLIQRYDQFGDPMYNWIAERIWVGEYAMSRSVNIESDTYTASDYISDNGILSFFDKFVLNGMYNILYTAARMTFPYFFILLPFGLYFSIKSSGINRNPLTALWVLLITAMCTMVLAFSVIPDKRLIFFLFPFFSIFATIPIMKLQYNKSNKFLHSINQNNVLILTVIVSVVIVSAVYTLGYEKPDPILEREKLEFTKYMIYDLNAKLLFEPTNFQNYFEHPMVYSQPDMFKSIKITEDWDKTKPFFSYPDVTEDRLMIYGESMDELVSNSEKFGLTHIMSTKEGNSFFSFVDELYENENKYPYLTKVFDAEKEDYEKLRIKVFRIDFDVFKSGK